MTYDEMWRRIAAVCGASEGKAVARMLMEEKFGLSLADLLCGAVESLPPADAEWTERAVYRLEHSEPVQYVLGWAWFCGHRFHVEPGVLIPRPETEWLVGRAADAVACCGACGADVLDIGTGSGCIAVSVAMSAAAARVSAWDISAEALGVASANAGRLGADVCFERRDALSLAAEADRWDVIVSNPPYICHRERAGMDANVADHEPEQALFVPDDDPLLFYRAIACYAASSLRHGGTLLFECNTLYAADTAAMLRAMGFDRVTVADDCFGLPRFVEGRWA